MPLMGAAALLSRTRQAQIHRADFTGCGCRDSGSWRGTNRVIELSSVTRDSRTISNLTLQISPRALRAASQRLVSEKELRASVFMLHPLAAKAQIFSANTQ